MPEMSRLTKIIEDWWEAFPVRSRTRGNIAGGLVILENLRANFDLDINTHKAPGSDQLRNASRSTVQRVLLRYGEERVLLKEGGRTNRGLMKNLSPLLDALGNAGIQDLPRGDREQALGIMQEFLTQKAIEKFNAAKLSFDYQKEMTSREIVRKILQSARERNKAGEVAEYLVGAKLSLRFPTYEIRNSAASAADEQSDESGDFQINDCIFHVTVAPNIGHYEKCERNLANGLRVYLLVPDDILAGTRQNVEITMTNRISVEAIESFVSQNIEEMSDFSGKQVPLHLRRLLETYNKRISEVETDLSLQIEIPESMKKRRRPC